VSDPAPGGHPGGPGGGPGGRGSRPGGPDLLLRTLGGLLALAGGAAGGLLAVLLVPLRVADAAELVGGLAGLAGTGLGSVRVPVAIVVAAGGNLLLVQFAGWVTGVRWGPLLPGLGWFLVIWMALRITTEGDRLMMPADWVGTLTLFGGTVVLVIGIVLGLTGPARPGTGSRVGTGG
jgi:hypothetical protein